MTRLECGRDREELTEHLIELKRANPYFVVASIFAFSCSAWFLETHGLTSAAQLWSLARFKVESVAARLSLSVLGKEPHQEAAGR
jgi:hypothetical protein